MMGNWVRLGAVIIAVLGSCVFPVFTNAADWENQAVPSVAFLKAVWGSSPNDVFAVGLDGTVLHYDGTSWTAMTSNTEEDLRGVWGSGPDNVFAVGDGGTIIRYDGGDWSEMLTGTGDHYTNNNLTGIWGVASDLAFAVGHNGTVIRYDGTQWGTEPSIPTSEHLWAVWMVDETEAYAAGDWGTIIRYAGGSWAVDDTSSNEFLYSIWKVPDGSLAFAGGRMEIILKYDPLLDMWMEIRSGSSLSQYIYGFWGFSEDTIMAVGSSGKILQYQTGGATWEPMETGTTAYLSGIWGSAPNNVFAVGNGGTILHYPVVADGDIDHDGAVGLGDAVLALQIAAGVTETVAYLDADVDGDARIGSEEAIYALGVAAGVRP